MGGAVKRISTSFGVHLLLGALCAALIFWLTSSIEDASEALRAQVSQSETAQATVQSFLDSARASLIQWALASLALGWAASAIFLLSAEKSMPENERDGATKMALWLGLLALSLAIAAVLWWRWLSIPDVGFALLFGNYATAVSIAVIAILLAYYLGTALTVKTSMKPSVPFAVRLPGME